MKPLNGLGLIRRILGTQAVYRCAKGGKLAVMVAIGTGLRRTPSRPGNSVPCRHSAGRVLIRASRSWVAIDDQPRSAFLGQIDDRPGGGDQANRRERRSTKVITRAVVFGGGQIAGKGVEIVSPHVWQYPCCAAVERRRASPQVTAS